MARETRKPDFDSMSQEELIRWLDKLAHPDGMAAMTDAAQESRAPGSTNAELEDVAWLDEDGEFDAETPPLSPPPTAPQLIDDDDDETPTALSALDAAVDDDTTDPLTWDNPAGKPKSPDRLPQIGSASDADDDDPLAWLESLAQDIHDSDSEDIESLTLADDDESLFSAQEDGADGFVDSLPGLVLDDEAFSTQSQAPVPDFLLETENDRQPADQNSERMQHEAQPTDQLTHAMLMDERMAELEAWYAGRLRALESAEAADTAAPLGQPPTIPPPGLAAGFNSARGKVANGDLEAALAEYETLLRANIGLDLVVSDMNWLLAQAAFRHEAAVHRVLGDALMRRGELQSALDVYRHAMSLLQEPR